MRQHSAAGDVIHRGENDKNPKKILVENCEGSGILGTPRHESG